MTLEAELADLENRLRDVGGHLDRTLALVPVNRSSWTRWKTGVHDIKTKKLARVREVFANAIREAAKDRVMEKAAAEAAAE